MTDSEGRVGLILVGQAWGCR